MGSETVKRIIRKELVNLGASLVTLTRIRGLGVNEDMITVNNIFVSMGECNGEEFEAIKAMRQNVEIKHNIQIVNVTIDL